jgi:hypothetical protein
VASFGKNCCRFMGETHLSLSDATGVVKIEKPFLEIVYSALIRRW